MPHLLRRIKLSIVSIIKKIECVTKEFDCDSNRESEKTTRLQILLSGKNPDYWMYAVLRQTEVALIAYGGRDQEFFVHLFFQQLVIRNLVDPVRLSLPGTTQGCVDSWWEGAGVFIAVKLLDGFGNSFNSCLSFRKSVLIVMMSF